MLLFTVLPKRAHVMPRRSVLSRNAKESQACRRAAASDAAAQTPCAAPSRSRCRSTGGLPAPACHIQRCSRLHFLAYLSGFLTVPWLSPGGGRGMTPACPSSRATVCDGCAPTDSQYLRQADRQTERQAIGNGRCTGMACTVAAVVLPRLACSQPLTNCCDSTGKLHGSAPAAAAAATALTAAAQC